MNKFKLNFGLTAIDYGFSLTHHYFGDDENIGFDGENMTIVILSCNRIALTIRLIDSIIEYVPDFKGEILIYDNASCNDDLKQLEEYLKAISLKIRLIKSSTNYGVAGGRNRAVAEVETGWVMILDNDIYFTGNPLEIFRKNITALGCKFLNVPLMNGDARTVYCNGGGFFVSVENFDKNVWSCSMYENAPCEMNVEFMPSLSSFLFGGAAIVDKELFLQCGGFDVGMFVGFEDLDFSITLFKKGYKIGSAGIFALVHDHKRLEDNSSIAYEEIRFSNEKLFESAMYFEKKHNLKVWSQITENWIKKRRKELGIVDTSSIHRSQFGASGENKMTNHKKRSILFCIHALVEGGAEKLLIDILHHIDADIFDVDVCVVIRGGVYDDDLPSYVNYFVYSENDAFPDKIYDVEIAFLEGEATKLIALHPSNAFKIAWVHTDMFAHRLSTSAYKNHAEETLCYSIMDHIVFVSQAALLQFEKLFPHIRINKTVIHNMINREEVIAKSQETPCPLEKTKLTMCTLARLFPVKGVARLIPVLSRLKKEGFDFHHWIIGDGYQRKKIEQLIEQTDLNDTVFLLGFQKNPFPYLKAADFFVSASFVEGLPLAVCEALCLFKPIIATNNLGTAEVLDNGKYGFLVEPDDESVYRGLKEMMSNESLRNEYALKAKAWSEINIFDLQKNIFRINDLLGHTPSSKSTIKQENLDRLMQEIARISSLVLKLDIWKGKTGIAILLYHYAYFKNDSKTVEYADNLIDIILKEIEQRCKKGLDDGLYDIVRGLYYLVKQEFIDADEDFFHEIDDILFKEVKKSFKIYDLNEELEKGIYIINRLASCGSSHDHIWRKRLIDCFHNLRVILMLKYTQHDLLVFPCKTWINFFHVCKTFREQGGNSTEIDLLHEELKENVKISFREERNEIDKYNLSCLLADTPQFATCFSNDYRIQSVNWMDASSFFVNRLITGHHIPVPQIVKQAILTVATDQHWFNDLLHQLKTDNAGLHSFGGLAWAMLQLSLEQTPS